MTRDAKSRTNGEKVRVVQVTHDLGIGGLPRVVQTLSEHLDHSRYEVEVLCLRDGGPLLDRLADRGIRSFVLKRRKTVLRADYFAASRIAKHFRARQPTIVHTHNTEAFVEGGFAAKISGVPVLINTDHAREFPDLRRRMFLEWLVSHVTDYVVAVSEDGKQNLRRFERIAERKLRTVHNGVDADYLKPAPDAGRMRQQLGIPERAPLIGLGSRFEPQKGLTYFLQAMPHVLRACPDVHAIVAGYGSLADELEAEARSLGISERVHFIGKVHTMSDVLACLDLFLLPSLWEGLPMAILEAMAVGVPIVATDVGGVTSALEDGRNAIVVQPADPVALARGIEQLLASSELRRELGANARADFEARFSAQAMARAYEELYEAALARR